MPHRRLVGRLEPAPQRMIDEIGHELGHREFVEMADDSNDRVQDDEYNRYRKKNSEKFAQHS
jgi:hypothetical protein